MKVDGPTASLSRKVAMPDITSRVTSAAAFRTPHRAMIRVVGRCEIRDA